LPIFEAVYGRKDFMLKPIYHV